MKKRSKVDKNTANTDIRAVVDTWNTQFTDLQKRKEAGEKISHNEVRSIIANVGTEIYSRGVRPETAGDTKLGSEFKEIYKKVEAQRFPLSSVSDSSTSDIRINAIQLAAYNSDDQSSNKGQIIAEIVRDPSFVPPNSRQYASRNTPNEDAPAIATTTVPTETLSIEQQSARASINLLAKLAPPDEIARIPRPIVSAVETEDLFGSKFGVKTKVDRSLPPRGASGVGSDQDAIPAQVVQMPVQLIQPIDNPNEQPKNALGRIIH